MTQVARQAACYSAFGEEKAPPAAFGNTVTINQKSEVCEGEEHKGPEEELQSWVSTLSARCFK